MDYPAYRALLATELVMADASGLALLDATLPQIISFAEDRIYQDSDLDFLGTHTVDATTFTFPGQRYVNIPLMFVIIEEVSLITPTDAQPDARGSKRVPLLRTTQAFVDSVWPSVSKVRAPQPYQTYFAIPAQSVVLDANNAPMGKIYIAPTVDSQYVVEIRGTFEPTPISVANPTTFLSLYYPSLFFAASMAIATGVLLKNFGAQSDNAPQAISWEMQYNIQKQSAVKRVQRQHSWGPGWVPSFPVIGALPRFAPIPTPQPQQGAQTG